MAINVTGKFKPAGSFKVVEDVDVEVTESYTGNLAGVTTQKEANDVLDAFAGGGVTDHGDLTGRDSAEQHPATAISVDTSTFSGSPDSLLEPTDTTVQACLERLDDAVSRVINAKTLFSAEEWALIEARTESATDHAAIIQDMIDAFQATDNGGTITFPNGLYSFFSGLRISKPGIKLIGSAVQMHGADPNTPEISINHETTFRALSGFTGTTVVCFAPIPTYSTGTIPQDGGDVLSRDLGGSAFKGIYLDCNLVAPIGLRWFNTAMSELSHYYIYNFTEIGAIIGGWFQNGIRAWKADHWYSAHDFANFKTAQRVSNGGSVYYCILPHQADQDDDEPGVGANWETYWTLEGDVGAVPALMKYCEAGQVGFAAIDSFLLSTEHPTADGVWFLAWWYSTLTNGGVYVRGGDAVFFGTGDNCTFQNVWSANELVGWKSGKAVSTGQVVIYDPNGAFYHDPGTGEYNLGLIEQNDIYDTTLNAEIYEVIGDGNLGATPGTDPLLSFLGYDKDCARAFAATSEASNLKFIATNFAVPGSFVGKTYSPASVKPVSELGYDIYGSQHAQYPVAGAYQLISVDPQRDSRFILDDGVIFFFDNGFGVNIGGSGFANAVFSNTRKDTEAALHRIAPADPNNPLQTGFSAHYYNTDGNHISIKQFDAADRVAYIGYGYYQTKQADWSVTTNEDGGLSITNSMDNGSLEFFSKPHLEPEIGGVRYGSGNLFRVDCESMPANNAGVFNSFWLVANFTVTTDEQVTNLSTVDYGGFRFDSKLTSGMTKDISLRSYTGMTFAFDHQATGKTLTVDGNVVGMNVTLPTCTVTDESGHLIISQYINSSQVTKAGTTHLVKYGTVYNGTHDVLILGIGDIVLTGNIDITGSYKVNGSINWQKTNKIYDSDLATVSIETDANGYLTTLAAIHADVVIDTNYSLFTDNIYTSSSAGLTLTGTNGINLVGNVSNSGNYTFTWRDIRITANSISQLANADLSITAYTGRNVTIESVTFDGGVVAGVGSLTVDNLNLDGTTLSSTGALSLTSGSNGDITLTPNGTGKVKTDNLALDGNTISSTNTNGDINLTPNGTGNVGITGGAVTLTTSYLITSSNTFYINRSSTIDRASFIEFDNGGTTALMTLERASGTNGQGYFRQFGTGGFGLYHGAGYVQGFFSTSTGNMSLCPDTPATSATDGFPYLPACAGPPTGTPTSITGHAPVVIDSTNNNLNFYAGSAWRGIGRAKITAASVNITTGSSSSNISTLQTLGDGNVYDLTEASTTNPGLDFYVEFTSVTAFNWVQILGTYHVGTTYSQTHFVAIQLYNWVGSAWVNFNRMPSDNYAAGYNTDFSFVVPGDANFIGTGGNAGKVRVRFRHSAVAGVNSHHVYLDCVALYN
jgi:hypothetical protein